VGRLTVTSTSRRGPHLRILVTNWNDRTSPYAGGADVHLHQVFGRLAQRGHEVTLLSAGWKGAEPEARLDGIAVHRTGGRHSFTVAARRYYERHLRSREFDIVVEDLNKVPLLVHRWSRAPFVLLVHHLWGGTAMRAAGPLVGAPTWASEALLLRAYRGKPVQAVSDSTAHDLVRRGIRPSDIRVITNGVEQPAGLGPPRPDSRPTLVSLGRLQRYKRVDLLLGIVARVRERVPDVRLVVIGDGPEAGPLRAQAAAAGLGAAVEFLGFVSEEVKRDALARAWLHVTASEREGWGLTVLEAGAYGVPTVAGDVPGLRDSVAHERSGLLVPSEDVAAFADAVVQLIEHGDRRAELGAGARRLAHYYSWDRAAVATEEHLHEVAVLGRSRRGWEPLTRPPLTQARPLPRTGPPPLAYGCSSYVLLAAAAPCDEPVPIRVTFGSEDAAGFRPGLLVEGLPSGIEMAVEAFASAVHAVPAEGGLLLQLPGWPVHPERWLWEEFGAGLRQLRPRAVYRI
jgi:glycosyltransferase involved in cell wall biosynthesis